MQETMLEFLKITAEAAGFGEPKGIGEIVGAVIGTFLSFLGIIFLILTIYGGFIWMTSGGNETKVLKAKETLRNAIIGLIIIVSAYAVTRFVFDSLLQATA
ncbi:MAG: MMCAP2_0565 family pilin-like conjugal transfer protein [Candidatus Falkowbacteria bacterium]